MPATTSDQWCTLSTESATSNARSAKGSASATARTAGAASSGRCASITTDGSIATTIRSRGS